MKSLAKSVARSTDIQQSSRPTSMDRTSGTFDGGKKSNVITYNGAELRDLNIMFPYGYVAGVPSDVLCQTIMNGATFGNIVAMLDESRPSVGPNEVILYSAGVTLKLKPDGTLAIECQNATIKSTGKTKLVDADGTIDVDYVIKLQQAHNKLRADHDQLRSEHNALVKRVEAIEGRI